MLSDETTELIQQINMLSADARNKVKGYIKALIEYEH